MLMDVQDGFRPLAVARSAHAQTLFGVAFRTGFAGLSPRGVEMRDGARLRLQVGAAPRGAPTVFLLHGLEGSARSHYIAGMARRCVARSWRPVALEMRGCGGVAVDRPRFYHSGATEDVADAIAGACALDPGAPLFVVGYSLGANIVANWLAGVGEGSERCPAGLAGAALVSPPFDLAACADQIDSGAPAFYRRVFLSSLKAKARDAARRFPGSIEARALDGARTLRAYDNAVTAPLHGFRDAADYYARCSSADRLGHIRTPTLVVASTDDPLVPGATLPTGVFRRSRAIRAAVTGRGGHLGFVGGTVRRPRYWAEDLVLAFIAARLGRGRASLG